MGDGDDTAFGGLGKDLIVLGDGDDTADGEEDDDRIFGEAGNDTLSGEGGDDILTAGDDDDTLDGGDGADQLFGEAGFDDLSGGAGNDVLVAGADDDTLDGGDDDDQLFGEAGNDTLSGGAGADILVAGEDDDTLDGGDDNDRLFGQGGDDELAGGVGNDQLGGGTGTDTLEGGEGDDLYVYASGDGEDTITDSAGTADVLILQGISSAQAVLESPDGNGVDLRFSASDVIHLGGSGGGLEYVQFADGVFTMQQLLGKGFKNDGTAGADFASGTGYADTITSGAGDDVVFADAGNDTLDLGDGADLADGGDGNDTITSGTGDDTAFGGSGSDTVNGGDGSDTLYGEAGSDNLAGGDGADTLAGGLDNDLLAGGIGDDTYFYARGDGVDTITENDATAGNADTLRFAADIASTQVRVGRSVDNLILTLDAAIGGGSVSISGYFTGGGAASSSGAGLVESITFGDGVTWNYTAAQAQLLNGTDGNDHIIGTTADDTLDGRGGNDTIYGRAGNDTLLGSAGFDLLVGETGNDTLDGGADGDTLGGGDGNDTLIGGSGFDQLYGDADNDVLNGGDDPDQLYGGTGSDTLNGGAASDNLYGGPGGDTYVIAAGDGNDTIDESVNSDYTVNSDIDTLRLTGVAPARATLARTNYYDLTVTLNPTDLPAGQTVRVSGHFDWRLPQRTMERIVFDDGTVWSAAYIQQQMQTGTAASDLLYGSVNADNITGLGGNDTIYGLEGNDTLNGGAGSDTLFGGAGDDTYVFNLGDGQDLVVDADGVFGGSGIDTLQFGAGITTANVTVTKAGVSDLLFTLNATDSVRLADYFGAQSYERMTFADGTVWTQDTIAQRFPINGTAGADTLTGTGAGDYLYGLAGNDTIHGGGGADVIDGGLGSDTIYGEDGDDRLIGGAGDTARANASDNLYGGNGNDVLILQGSPKVLQFAYGGAGNDIYRGGAGNNWMEDSVIGGNDLFIGTGSAYLGAGTDVIIGAGSVDGDREQTGVRGRQVILYNKGDGDETFHRMGGGGVLSIGGGALYSNLKLSRNTSFLFVAVGSQQLAFDNWYDYGGGIPANKSISTLQIVIEGTRKYDPASTDPLYHQKIQTFDFLGLVAAFDAAQAAGQRFSVADHLTQFRTGGSDTQAYGGALAYQYATTGSVDALTTAQHRAIMADPALGVSMQSIDASTTLLAAAALRTTSLVSSTDNTLSVTSDSADSADSTTTTASADTAAPAPDTAQTAPAVADAAFAPPAAAHGALPAAASDVSAAQSAPNPRIEAAAVPSIDLSAWIAPQQVPWPGAQFSIGDQTGIAQQWSVAHAAMQALPALDEKDNAARWSAPPLSFATGPAVGLSGSQAPTAFGTPPIGLVDPGAFSVRLFTGLAEGQVKLPG